MGIMEAKGKKKIGWSQGRADLMMALVAMPEKAVSCGVLVTFAGICLLSLQGSLSLRPGDLLCISYAIHIIITDRLAKQEDGLSLGVWQLGFAGVFGETLSAKRYVGATLVMAGVLLASFFGKTK